MAVRLAYGDSQTYYRTKVGEDAGVIDLGPAKVIEPPKLLESPEVAANRARVFRNLLGKA